MLTAGAITPTRRALVELLAEARARTVLLVSSLDDKTLASRPAPELGSVLAELERIVRFEQQLLSDQSESPNPSSYDDWFDLMTDVRQRVLQQLDTADLNEVSGAERYRRVLEHEYRRGSSAGSYHRAAPKAAALPLAPAFRDPGRRCA